MLMTMTPHRILPTEPARAVRGEKREWSRYRIHSSERATRRAKAGGRDDQVDDLGRHPDSGPIAGYRPNEWWRPLDTG
jgi:hypothetical protein